MNEDPEPVQPPLALAGWGWGGSGPPAHYVRTPDGRTQMPEGPEVRVACEPVFVLALPRHHRTTDPHIVLIMALRSAFGLVRSTAPLRALPRMSAGAPASSVMMRPAVSTGQMRLLSAETRSTIDEAVKAKPLVVFIKGTLEAPMCGFSRRVVTILDMADVPPSKIQSYNVLADDELRQSLKEYSDWPTFPQMYINGEFVGGADIVVQST